MMGPIARIRRSLYSAGFLRSQGLPRPVVSVGNLTAGGAGKTPHVRFLASWFVERGVRIAILSRGYGRKSRGVIWVSDGSGKTEGARVAGDEPALLARSLPEIPVLVGESRFDAGCECLRRRDVDAFLLDDGFQHLALRRDADLLLVDAARGLGNRKVLPFGPLREPAEHARFADALIVTKCGDEAKGKAVAASVPFPAGRPVAFSRLAFAGLVDRSGNLIPTNPPAGEVTAFSGLARNDQFLETLKGNGFRVCRFIEFGDHHWYSERDLRDIASASGGRPVLTTEKDLARLPDRIPFDVFGVRVDVEFFHGWEGLSRLLLERIDRAAVR